MSAPFFTIISCARNAGKYARRSVESVLSQTFPDYEYFFVDDASEDDTLDQVLSILVDIDRVESLSRFYFSKRNERKWKLFNFLSCVRHAKGEVLVELDGDDWFADDKALETIHVAYARPRVEATAGSFHGFTTDKFVYAKTQPVPGVRFMQNGFCNSVPAPRTWKRALTLRSLKELPELYLDPTTGAPWKTNSDIALFAPALFWAKDIAAIEEILVEVNWQSEAHDDMLEPALMQDEGARLYEWCLNQEWKWAEGQLKVFRKDQDQE